MLLFFLSISQLRQLITDQTDILGGAQLLLHENKVINCETREPIIRVLQTTKDNPIFVFNKLPEYKPYRKPVASKSNNTVQQNNTHLVGIFIFYLLHAGA